MKCLAFLTMALGANAVSLLNTFNSKKPLDMQGVAAICENIKCDAVTCVPPFKLEYINAASGLPSCCGSCKAPEEMYPLPTTFFKSQYLVDACEKRPATCNHETGHNVQCFQQNCGEGEEIQCGMAQGTQACCPQCGKWEYKFVDNAWGYFLPPN